MAKKTTYSREQNAAVIRQAISQGRLAPPGPRAKPPEELKAKTAERYANALRANPDAKDLVYRDLRGHALTPEHPTQAVHLKATAHRREQWAAGNAKTGRAANADQLRDALKHVKGDTIHVAVHGKRAIESDPRKGTEIGWASKSYARSDLEDMLDEADELGDEELEQLAGDVFGVEGMFLEVDQISIGAAP